MSFEIKYKFFNKTGTDYDRSKEYENVKRLGKEYEDVPLEKLAQTIMMQLARRDIFIFDVEIYERVKKKINFKETKNGILLKNKKFMLDGTVEYDNSMEEEEESAKQPSKQNLEKALRWEFFCPDNTIAKNLCRKYNLTSGMKYPIIREENSTQRVNVPGAGLTDLPSIDYLVINDKGEKVLIPCLCFSTENPQEKIVNNQPKLSYVNNDRMADMPVLRR